MRKKTRQKTGIKTGQQKKNRSGFDKILLRLYSTKTRKRIITRGRRKQMMNIEQNKKALLGFQSIKNGNQSTTKLFVFLNEKDN